MIFLIMKFCITQKDWLFHERFFLPWAKYHAWKFLPVKLWTWAHFLKTLDRKWIILSQLIIIFISVLNLFSFFILERNIFYSSSSIVRLQQDRILWNLSTVDDRLWQSVILLDYIYSFIFVYSYSKFSK